MDPIPFAVLSLSVASMPLILPMILSSRLPLLWDKRYVWSMMALGFLGTTVTSLLLFYAGKTVPASRIVILGQIEIIFSLILGAAVLKEQIGLKQLAATTLILSGMLLALKAGRFTSFGRGDVMILLMPLCFQFSHLISKRLLRELDPTLVSAGRTLYGLLFLLPLVFYVPASAWAQCLGSGRALGLILFQGLVINSLSLWLWYTSLRRVDLSKLTTLLLTYPLLTLFMAKFLPGMDESVSMGQFFGAALVILGGSFLSKIPSKTDA